MSIASKTKQQLKRMGESSKSALPKAKQAIKNPKQTAAKLVKAAADHPTEVAAVAGVAGLALGVNKVTRHAIAAAASVAVQAAGKELKKRSAAKRARASTKRAAAKARAARRPAPARPPQSATRPRAASSR